jgi:hypothetical protein
MRINCTPSQTVTSNVGRLTRSNTSALLLGIVNGAIAYLIKREIPRERPKTLRIVGMTCMVSGWKTLVDIRMRIAGGTGTISPKSFIDESINFYSFQPVSAS